MFWDCSILKPFWQGVQAEIQAILNLDLPQDPVHYMIGLSPEGDIEKRRAQLLVYNFFLLVARKMITWSWLKPLPPHPPPMAGEITGCVLNGNNNSQTSYETELIFVFVCGCICIFIQLFLGCLS